MATRQEAKQALIDRISNLASSATKVEDVNYLSKALKQIGSNPRYFDTSREKPTNELRLEEQASDTTTVHTLHNGIHREREETDTGYLADDREPLVQGATQKRINFQNDATLGNRPEFGIWAGHSDAHGAGCSYDSYLRPHDRTQFYSSGNTWRTTCEGGPATGTYSSHQKYCYGTINNTCYLNTGTRASSENTSNVWRIPSRTNAVGEVGHYRIKMGGKGIANCRMLDTGDQMRRENIECGTAQLDHRHAYLKMKGKILALREKWMPAEQQTYTGNQGWPTRETYDSPSSKDISYGWDAVNNQVQTFEPGFGSVGYHKKREEFIHINQISAGVSTMIGKVYRHVNRIRRLTLLEDVLKEENAVYFKFNYGTGFNSSGSDQIEPQKCQKITQTDDGSIFTTMLDPGTSTYALGRIDNTWLTKTNGVVQNLVIENAGSGYASAPTVTIANPNGSGSAAVATLSITGGRVTGFQITNGGSGYSLSKEDGYGHPTVTVDNTGTGGTGCVIKSCIMVTADFSNVATLPTHGTIYGHGTNSYVGQMIVMSRDRSKTVHFAPYYGYGCGIVSYIIDRKTNSWSKGYFNTDTDDGCQVIAFREGQFIFFRGVNWAGPGDHQAYLYYEQAQPTIDATNKNEHQGWKSDNVGQRLDSWIAATNYPTAVPIW